MEDSKPLFKVETTAQADGKDLFIIHPLGNLTERQREALRELVLDDPVLPRYLAGLAATKGGAQ